MNKRSKKGGKECFIYTASILNFLSNETENKLDLLYFNSMEIIISFILINKHNSKAKLMILAEITGKIHRNLA